jgi:hypothetical protein
VPAPNEFRIGGPLGQEFLLGRVAAVCPAYASLTLKQCRAIILIWASTLQRGVVMTMSEAVKSVLSQDATFSQTGPNRYAA